MPVTEAGANAGVSAEPATPTFVCTHCGAAMLIIETFLRGQSIRAPPQQVDTP
ncbi:hypothetical protein LP414_22680 [Polaromonas sp. P1(28)-13]|nr:hypothetical protein LP414_22680 [Polaromonas sp. P1(28)-13]